jgi:uncharacterized membrane protein YbhN (UPF0104 family)
VGELPGGGPTLRGDLIERKPQLRLPRRRLLRQLALVAVPTAIAVAVGIQSKTLVGATLRIRQVSVGWLVAALAAEAASYLASGELQHHLLASASVRLSRTFFVALSYVGGALSALLPAGAAVSAGYTYRRLARRGVSPTTTVWLLVTSGVLSTTVLGFFGLIGAEIRSDGLLSSAIGRVVGFLILATATGGVALVAWASRRQSVFDTLGAFVLHVSGWARPMLRRPGSPVSDQPTVFLWAGDDPAAIAAPGWLGGCALAGANWLADGAVLILSFAALGLRIPWQGLLLAYVVSQVAAALPLVGCIGVFEATLTTALVCIGVKANSALAVVLLYRLVSFWSTLPIAWLAWTRLRRLDSRGAMRSSESYEQRRAAA